MPTNFDAPRTAVGRTGTESLEELRAAEAAHSTRGSIDEDGEIVDSFVPPTGDLSGVDLEVAVTPRQSNEFTCAECFVVQRRSRIDHVEPDGSEVCQDCA